MSRDASDRASVRSFLKMGLWLVHGQKASGRKGREVPMSSRCAWFLTVMMLFPMGVVGADEPAILLAPETPSLTRQQQEVWKVSQEWRDAYNNRDLDTIAHLTVDDFIGSTDDGIFMSKAGLLKRLSTHPPEADQRKNVRDVRVRVNGNTGVVNYRLSLTEEGFDNGRLIFELRRTEVFQKSNGDWRRLLPMTVSCRSPIASQ